MSQPPAYMAEPWFAQLQQACARESKAAVAARLGVSAPLVYQVLNGSGLYGEGKASTAKLAARVVHQLGSYVCPHLSAESGADQVISSDQCRAYAHRPAPTSAPRDLAHWQACRKCPHAALSAPPTPRPVVPRKRNDNAEPAGQQPALQAAAGPQPVTAATEDPAP